MMVEGHLPYLVVLESDDALTLGDRGPRNIRERGLRYDCTRCLDLHTWQRSPSARDGGSSKETQQGSRLIATCKGRS